jgi:AmiR/NasT family two-component response regulator
MPPVRILLVEDDPTTALLVSAVLRREGYWVVGCAANGLDAIALAQAERPDLILMDIQLSGEMDGIDAAFAIREGADSPAVLDRARSAEPHGYLLKPLDPRSLRPAIEMAIHKHRMEREREDLIARLEKALAEVEQLRGLFPVCAWCKKVRDDDGYWDSIEGYLAKHLNTQYTHGICQDCAKKIEAEL